MEKQGKKILPPKKENVSIEKANKPKETQKKIYKEKMCAIE